MLVKWVVITKKKVLRELKKRLLEEDIEIVILNYKKDKWNKDNKNNNRRFRFTNEFDPDNISLTNDELKNLQAKVENNKLKNEHKKQIMTGINTKYTSIIRHEHITAAYSDILFHYSVEL